MVKLIIRDDDTNYFTTPTDIEEVYGRLSCFPVTLAVIPNMKYVNKEYLFGKKDGSPSFIGDNHELVDYLKERLKNGTIDVAMHGITHDFCVIDNYRMPEMLWRDNDSNLVEVIRHWKQNLEYLFDYPINTFVAPANKIGKHAIKAVYKNDLNFSGIIDLSFNRDKNMISLKNYIKRFYVRAVHGIAYPGVIDYGTHKELNANNGVSFDNLIKIFNYCDKKNLPMAINVHYWHIQAHPSQYKDFFSFIDYAISHGAVPTKLSDLFR